ncbi:hypothetical protein DL767_002191 [Monosporascus sp. MG133]|nr:hypothetical protein DL767_002191 [Monosporascus sp. MG133]
MGSTICVVVAMLEALVAHQLMGVSGFKKAFFILFVIHYLGLKCYRIFLYPKYFSPLRHIPGPQVSGVPMSRHYPGIATNTAWRVRHTEPTARVGQPGSQSTLAVLYQLEEDSQAFWISSPKLEPVFPRKAKEVTWLFDRAIDANNGGATAIDCTDTFARVTLDAVSVALLGVDLSGLKETPISNADKKSQRATEGDTLGKILMFANAFVPVRWMPLETNGKFLFATKWLNAFLTQLVRNRTRDIRAAYAADKYARGEARDLVTFIIEESLPGGPAEEITEEEIVGDLLQLMAAGHDTSANILSWSLYIMATKQDIQDKLREEMLLELGEAPEPAYAQIEALPYLDNFTRETLRVYTSATTMHRQAVVDETICGIFIPKGTTFDVVPHVTLMNPLIWGDGVDEFDPTRWDRLSEEARSPYAFSTFSNGPRVCLGRSFAFREIKIILVEMVRNYRFLAVEGPFTVENPSLTLRPRGLRVLLEKRL